MSEFQQVIGNEPLKKSDETKKQNKNGKEFSTKNTEPQTVPSCNICGKPYSLKKFPNLNKAFYIPDCDCEEKQVQEDNKKRIFNTLQTKYSEPFWKSMNASVFKDWTFENFKASGEIRDAGVKIWQFVKDWASKKVLHLKPGLFITGDSGNKKTYLAIASANFIIRHYITVVFVDMPNMLDLLREGYRKNNYFKIMDILIKVDFLILDDIGIEKLEEDSWVKEKVYQIINNRYLHRKGLIVTSQYDLSQLESRLGIRITRRIKDICSVVKIGKTKYEVS